MRPSLSKALLFCSLPLGACDCRKAGSLEVEASVNPTIATVIEVSWTTDQPGTSYVEYGLSESYGMTTPTSSEATTDHQFTLLGLPPLTTVYYRAVTDMDGAEADATGVIDTNGLPADLLGFNVDINDASLRSSESFILGPIVGLASTLYVVDREGEYLWYYSLGEDEGEDTLWAFDVQFKQGTNHILHNLFTPNYNEEDSFSVIRELSLSGEIIDEIDTPNGHHAFTQLPNGGIAYIRTVEEEWYDKDFDEYVTVMGDAIAIVEPGEDPYDLYTTWDGDIEPKKHENWEANIYSDSKDWTHGNRLDYYEDTDTFLFSLGFADIVLEVDGTSGELLRQFGGEGGYEFADGTTPIKFQHDPSWTTEGTLLMTCAVGFGPKEEVLGVEYVVDDASETLEEVWSYGDGLNAIAEGLARDMPNGNRLINWGASGVMREVTQDGETAWNAELEMGGGFLSAHPFEDWYTGE